MGKKLLIGSLVLIILILGVFYFIWNPQTPTTSILINAWIENITTYVQNKNVCEHETGITVTTHANITYSNGIVFTKGSVEQKLYSNGNLVFSKGILSYDDRDGLWKLGVLYWCIEPGNYNFLINVTDGVLYASTSIEFTV